MPTSLPSSLWAVFSRQATFIFLAQFLWVFQHGANISPYGGIESVHANGFVPTDARPTESERIHPEAAIVRIGGSRVGREARTARAVVGVPTAATFQQSLEQIARAALPLAKVLSIFGQLLSGRVK